MSDRKAAATEFLRLSSSGDARRAFAHYASDGLRHHNPFFHGDAESLVLGMEESAKQFPHKTLTVLLSVEEGDLVATHSRVSFEPGGMEVSVMHIFRFEGDRIVELWDVGRPVPEDSPNENGAF
jgi:predicted SnoaL-like aldol condensation-catalyzing enzyme